MPTRKQRRRAAKERRHEYETVWVDEEGNELEEPPEDGVAPAREKHPEKRSDGKPKPKAKAQQQRGSRPARVPPPPSWRRSIRRGLIWVGVLAALLIWLQSSSKHPTYGPVVLMVAVYALLFPVFTYYLDRFVYRRYQARQQAQSGKGDTRKR